MAITTGARPATVSADTHDEIDTSATTAPSAAGNRIESQTLAASNSRDARHTLIAESAYYRAQQRGFAAGEDWRDWFAAEREVDALLDPDL